MCAHDQDKFWEYHDKLYENQRALSPENLKQYAADLALDGELHRFDLVRFWSAADLILTPLFQYADVSHVPVTMERARTLPASEDFSHGRPEAPVVHFRGRQKCAVDVENVIPARCFSGHELPFLLWYVAALDLLVK